MPARVPRHHPHIQLRAGERGGGFGAVFGGEGKAGQGLVQTRVPAGRHVGAASNPQRVSQGQCLAPHCPTGPPGAGGCRSSLGPSCRSRGAWGRRLLHNLLTGRWWVGACRGVTQAYAAKGARDAHTRVQGCRGARSASIKHITTTWLKQPPLSLTVVSQDGMPGHLQQQAASGSQGTPEAACLTEQRNGHAARHAGTQAAVIVMSLAPSLYNVPAGWAGSRHQ